jgi:Sortase domain
MTSPRSLAGRLLSLGARLLALADRLLPALLMASSVTLLAAGLLWYGSPDAVGTGATTTAAHTTSATFDPGNAGDPGTIPGASAPTASSSAGASAAPTRSGVTPAPGTSPAASPSGPFATPIGGGDPAVATRVVIPSLLIDLPIVSRDLAVPGQGPDQYPPCDVALYHTDFVQPGQAGTTYLYAHARAGMFLPLLTASQVSNGTALIGDVVQVYTDDDRLFVYQITLVRTHATDFALATDVPPGASQLVLQTSEGPRGTVPKLQVLAEPIDVQAASDQAAHPRARPRACYNTP